MSVRKRRRKGKEERKEGGKGVGAVDEDHDPLQRHCIRSDDSTGSAQVYRRHLLRRFSSTLFQYPQNVDAPNTSGNSNTASPEKYWKGYGSWEVMASVAMARDLYICCRMICEGLRAI